MHAFLQAKHSSGVHSFTDKKSTTFPGLSRTPMRNFPGPFQSPRMLKYKEKKKPEARERGRGSWGEGSEPPPHQLGGPGSTVSSPLKFGATWYVKIHYSNALMRNFEGYISMTFQDQHDFPGLSRSWNFKEKHPRLSRRRGNPDSYKYRILYWKFSIVW